MVTHVYKVESTTLNLRLVELIPGIFRGQETKTKPLYLHAQTLPQQMGCFVERYRTFPLASLRFILDLDATSSFTVASMSIEDVPPDWSIQEVAALAGTTSRTLRHYDSIGLLLPSRIASNGYRHYDQQALVRLQRILLLRELGLGLPAIAAVLTQENSATSALRSHVAWLRDEQNRLSRLIASVEKTIAAEAAGEEIMAKDMLDGFDHTTHKEEVEQRWGKAAYASSDAWWRGKSTSDQAAWKAQVAELNGDWITLSSSGVSPASAAAQELARRHVAWLASIPGTPAASPGGNASDTAPGGDICGYVLGLADMYVSDPRFAANYGGVKGAEFVRDALNLFAQREL